MLAMAAARVLYPDVDGDAVVVPHDDGEAVDR